MNDADFAVAPGRGANGKAFRRSDMPGWSDVAAVRRSRNHGRSCLPLDNKKNLGWADFGVIAIHMAPNRTNLSAEQFKGWFEIRTDKYCVRATAHPSRKPRRAMIPWCPRFKEVPSARNAKDWPTHGQVPDR